MKNRFAIILGIVFLGGLLLAPLMLTRGSEPATASSASADSSEPVLEARAVLPADTFWGGLSSGSQLGTDPINGRTPPFSAQPAQGISAVIKASGEDQFWVMPDNGSGSTDNSADFLLRVYLVEPDFETTSGGNGTIGIHRFLQFRDPEHHIPFEIVNENTAERLLTGADFDIESVLLHESETSHFQDTPFREIVTKRPR
jgi:glycerophosphoryl diester phosphodiesterase